MYLFECGVESGDVLRIGQRTVSVEHNGDGPAFNELVNEKGEKYLDPVYPWFSLRNISELSDENIQDIGEAVKRHLTTRKALSKSKQNTEQENETP